MYIFALIFSISCSGDHPHLHSFPTRRSSDLTARDARQDRDLAGSLDGAHADPHADADGPRHQVHRLVRPRVLARGRLLRSEEHTSELQSQSNLVCRLLLEKKKKKKKQSINTL